jgi:hypothetical protein
LLPLHKETFHILVARAGHDRHGCHPAGHRGGHRGRHNISRSTLYNAVRRMMGADLIEELDEPILIPTISARRRLSFPGPCSTLKNIKGIPTLVWGVV